MRPDEIEMDKQIITIDGIRKDVVVIGKKTSFHCYCSEKHILLSESKDAYWFGLAVTIQISV